MSVYAGFANAVVQTSIYAVTPAYNDGALQGGHAHYMALSGTALRTAIGLAAGLCFVYAMPIPMLPSNISLIDSTHSAFGYGQGDIGGLFIQETWAETFPKFLVPHIAGTSGSSVEGNITYGSVG